MKRVLSLTLALLMTVLLFGTAGAPFAHAEEENPYVGLWKITGQQQGDTTTVYADMGMKVYLDFQSNGLIYGLMVTERGAEEEYMAYVVTGENTLNLYEGDAQPLSGIYDPSTQTITVTEPNNGTKTFVQRANGEQMPDASALIDRSQEDQLYYIYQMTTGGKIYNMLEFLPVMDMDVHDFYLELDTDGTGYMQFGDEDSGGDITWTDSVFIPVNNPDTPAPYTRESNHILLNIDDQIFAFAPEAEVEALLILMEAQKVETPEIPADQVKSLSVETVAGLWAVTKVQMGAGTIPLTLMDMEATMEFFPDGTVIAIMKTGDDADTSTMTYEITGETTLVFHDEDTDTEATYDPATDTITVIQPGSGNMILERAASTREPVPFVVEVPETPAPASAALVGQWIFTKAIAMGIEISAEQMDTAMALTLNADGTAILDTVNSSAKLSWALTEENTVPLTVGSDALFTLTYDGTVLILTQSGVDLVFEKQTGDQDVATEFRSNANVDANAPTVGQKNALEKAYSYLKYSSFSYSGLIEQLEYEKFSHEEAVYAVDNCGANWFEQAEKKADSYLRYSSFSYTGLIKQLEYEGFTNEQAVHAVDKCEADWYEQAVKTAERYLKYSSFSKSGLLSQLEYEGFTREQAAYAVERVGY